MTMIQRVIDTLSRLRRSVLLSDSRRRGIRSARIEDREPIDLERIYSTFYAASGLRKEDVIEIWREVAQILDVHPEKMRPSDRFDREFAPVATFSFPGDELEDLHDRMLDRCALAGCDKPTALPESLDAYVRLLSRRY